MTYPFVDIALARRLELAEGNTNRDLIETRKRLDASCGACSIEVAGALAMFDGIDSPLTQTFALGMSVDATDSDLEILERFFSERGADTHHEVSPLSAPATLESLTRRGYEPIEFTSVLYRPIDGAPMDPPRGDSPAVRIVSRGDAEVWGRTAAKGWQDVADFSDFFSRIAAMTIESRLMKAFLAEENGVPVATGALGIHDGVALLAGASTVPEGRRRGAQRALLEARLNFAAGAGCDLAMMGAAPGSASQRNAERQGFRIAYTRIKWRKALSRPD